MGLWMATALVVGNMIDGPSSAVWEQAANRLPSEPAVLRAPITGEWRAVA
jgi:hypothetical protein